MVNSVVLVSGVQQTESVIGIHIPTLVFFFKDSFPIQSIERSSLCYSVGDEYF